MFKRLLATGILTGTAFVALACGGDDGGLMPGDAPDAGDVEAGAEAGDPTNGAEIGAPSGDAGTAVATIDGETIEFEMYACVALFGGVGGGGRAADGSDIEFSIDLSPEGDEGGYVRIIDNVSDRDWRAGGDTADAYVEVEPEESMIESFDVDGSSGKGSGTFVNIRSIGVGEHETTDGSFRVTC